MNALLLTALLFALPVGSPALQQTQAKPPTPQPTTAGFPSSPGKWNNLVFRQLQFGSATSHEFKSSVGKGLRRSSWCHVHADAHEISPHPSGPIGTAGLRVMDEKPRKI